MIKSVKSILNLFLVAVFFLAIGSPVTKAEAKETLSFNVNSNSDGVAVDGYDLTTYFDKTGPQKGSKYHSLYHKGAYYRFASAQNLQKFSQAPEKFLPAYGGYCAYGVVLGKKFDIAPDAWRIVDDVLFFQLDKGTRLIWEENRAKNIDIGARIWPNIEHIPADDL